MSEIKTYDDSFSNLLVEIQGMLGINSRRDASEHLGTLDLVKRLFSEAFDQLHENYYWLDSDVVQEFTLEPGQTVGGGFVFDECSKKKPAFDVNLTHYKNFHVVELIDSSSGRSLRPIKSLSGVWVPSFMLLTRDTCREIKVFPAIKVTTKYLIHFKDVDYKVVGLDGLKREFLKYATAFKLSVRLNIPLPQGFAEQYREIKERLSAGGTVGSQSIKESIWINDECF